MSGQTFGGAGEVLVILRGEDAPEAYRRLQDTYRVRQSASQRVLVVESSPEELAGLRQIPGVTAVAGGEQPQGVAEGLDEGESLFVAAWLSRAGGTAPKQRTGEGLSWDAEGLLPPDPPRGASGSGTDDG